MAFAPAEARRGALAAVLAFAILIGAVSGGSILLDGGPGSGSMAAFIAISAFLISGAFALATALTLHPVIRRIGRRLRTQRRLWVHSIVYLLFSGVVGAVIGSGLYAMPFAFMGITVEFGTIIAVAGFFALATALSTTIGWAYTVWRALRDDRT